MPNLTAQFFVKFKPTAKPPVGFRPDSAQTFAFPVYAIDIDEDNTTRFLLANHQDDFVWVPMTEVCRSKPNYDAPRPHKPLPPRGVAQPVIRQ